VVVVVAAAVVVVVVAAAVVVVVVAAAVGLVVLECICSHHARMDLPTPRLAQSTTHARTASF
jgi:hypothetical protein